MPELKGILMIVAGLGTSGIGIFGVYRYLSPRDVESHLRFENYTLFVDTKDDSEWNRVKSENTDTNKLEKIKKFLDEHKDDENIKTDDVTPEKIKKSCEKLMKKKNTKENLDVEKEYCGKK